MYLEIAAISPENIKPKILHLMKTMPDSRKNNKFNSVK